jgi:putative N-acetylmannosamine-6-phosphate epimerase
LHDNNKKKKWGHGIVTPDYPYLHPSSDTHMTPSLQTLSNLRKIEAKVLALLNDIRQIMSEVEELVEESTEKAEEKIEKDSAIMDPPPTALSPPPWHHMRRAQSSHCLK